MPFNHNHPLLLRQVPPNAKRALDVGMRLRSVRPQAGRPRAARRGIDEHGPMIDAARALGAAAERVNGGVDPVAGPPIRRTGP
ncbi:hypothetical protein ACTG9Q_29700 [Actinokineospora sp. 24-640]